MVLVPRKKVTTHRIFHLDTQVLYATVGFGQYVVGQCSMRENLAQRVLEGFVAFSSLSGFALPAGFQDKSTGTNAGAPPAAVASDNPQGLQDPKLKSATKSSFRPIDSNQISTDGMSFQSNSQALKIHQSINADIRRGQPIPASSLKALFVALSAENIKGIKPSFFESYAAKFNDAGAVKLMIESIIPFSNGHKSLSRGSETVPRLSALRTLGNSFPKDTSIDDKRSFFESFRNDSDLNIRALSLMLCINSNVNPKANYLPSEIIRASQQLGYMNRLRGDEFRLGILLRDSLLRTGSKFSLDSKTLNQIKMPLLRRAQTIERRNPGITESLIQASEDAYIDFLSEHAITIRESRDALGENQFFSVDKELFTVLHSSDEFHYGSAKDIAKAFRLKFDPKTHVIKGDKNPASPVGKNGYFGLLSSLSKSQDQQDKALIWINTHGNNSAFFFTRGEAEEATGGGSPDSPLLPTEYVSWEEEAKQLIKLGGLPGIWMIVDSCEGWDYSEQLNELLVAEYLKKMSVEQMIATQRIPGRLIGSQCDMLSVGNVVTWYDEDLPEDKQIQVKMNYSRFFFELMRYCQAKTMGVDIDKLETIGATDKVFTCTFRDVYEVDERLSNEMETRLADWWSNNEGKIFDYLKTNRIDPSVQSSKLFDIDKTHRDVIERLRIKGYKIPDPKSKVPPILRNSDYVNEISHWHPLWPNGATWS
jgi:hypothetical protein